LIIFLANAKFVYFHCVQTAHGRKHAAYNTLTLKTH